MGTARSISETPAESTADQYRYAAFISYRHADLDRRWATWLHTTLETYRVPRRLAAERNLPRRLGRVFRDEEELSVSSNLKSEIEIALLQSRFLIVICSPRTPGSEWVNKEVERFRQIGRGDKILALLIEGEPFESFPRALCEIRKSVTDPKGISSEKVEEVEPLAADVRAQGGPGGHGRTQAKLRILAQILGVHYDDLRQRERLRRRRLRVIGVLSTLVAATLIVAAIGFGLRSRTMHRAGELARRFDTALDGRHGWSPREVAGFDSLLTEWETVNPEDSYAARCRLDRALAADADDQMHKPYLQPADVATIRDELALLRNRDSGEANRLDGLLQSRLRSWSPVVELKAPFKGLDTSPLSSLFTILPDSSAVAFAPPKDSNMSKSVALTDVKLGAETQVTMALDPSWEDVSNAWGLAFGPMTSPSPNGVSAPLSDFPGYVFLCNPLSATLNRRTTMRKAREQGGILQVSIMRGQRMVRRRTVSSAGFPKGPLQMSVTRQGDRIRFVVNGVPSLELVESFPETEARAGYVGLVLQPGQRVTDLSVLHHLLPANPNLLEAADAQFIQGAFAEALAGFTASAGSEKAQATRQEALFKQALCLRKLGRAADATALLEPLVNEPGERWPPAAGFELWLIYREQNRDDSSAVLDLLHSRFSNEQLAAVASEEMRTQMAGVYYRMGRQTALLRRPQPQEVAQLQEVLREEDIIGLDVPTEVGTRISLARAYEELDNPTAAMAIVEAALSKFDGRSWFFGDIAEEYCCLMPTRPQREAALRRLERDFASPDSAMQSVWFQLLRAALLHDLGRLSEAQIQANGVLALAQTGRASRYEAAHAALMVGLIREDMHDQEGAREAWSQGWRLFSQPGTSPDDTFETTLQHMITRSGVTSAATVTALACFADAPDEQLQKVLDAIQAYFTSSPTLAWTQGGAIRIPTAAVRAGAADPRCRTIVRHYAFAQMPRPQLAREAARLIAEYCLRADSLVGAPSADQQAVYTFAATAMMDGYEHGKFGRAQALQLGMTWKGIAGTFGWKALSRTIDSHLRASLAYIFGLRYVQLGNDAASRDFFKQALDGAGNDAPLKRVAREAIDHPPTAAGASSRPAPTTQE